MAAGTAGPIRSTPATGRKLRLIGKKLNRAEPADDEGLLYLLNGGQPTKSDMFFGPPFGNKGNSHRPRTC